MNEDELQFDESGNLVDNVAEEAVLPRPCPIEALDGSWLLEFRSAVPVPWSGAVRGPMRIEVAPSSLRVSGDVYVRRPHRPGAVVPLSDDVESSALPVLPKPQPWYPQLPPSQYSWYFRSAGATYAHGELRLKFIRHLWDQSRQEFVSTDTGDLVLRCSRPLVNRPWQERTMSGFAVISGGLKQPVTATKTSSMYRGCRIEVDVMTDRKWPAGATSCAGDAITFQQVYRTAGWDVRVSLSDVDVPDDAVLTIAELQTLIATHREPATSSTDWELWMLAGSADTNGNFGVMFDVDAVPREGVVGFADARFGNQDFVQPSARGQALDDVPLAFLRTLTHEAGHAFNLFHPKHDVHLPPIGTSIMNQTGDVMGFASPAKPYPCNASMVFDEHSRNSLIHSPDPQVRPGWRNFGWGHGSLGSSAPEPVDFSGFARTSESTDIELSLRIPADVHQGEYVIAEVEVTNVGGGTRDVTSTLNLAEGDLRLLRRSPSDEVDQIHDVVVACGPRRTVALRPRESLVGRAQLFFTSVGYTFDEIGTHEVFAEFDPGVGEVARSAPVCVRVRPPANDAERDYADLTGSEAVGLAVALGDFGADREAGERLAATAERFPATDTGAAFALTVANSLARSHTDFRTADVRTDDLDEAVRFLELAAVGRSASRLLELATTVASPIETDAPVVDLALDLVVNARAPGGELDQAASVVADFRR